MRKSLRIIPVLLLFAAIGAPTVARADITYAVDETVGAGSATGFITTNGTLGILDTADILNWNLTLNDGTNPPVDLEGPASGNNSLVLFSRIGFDGDALATDLRFRHRRRRQAPVLCQWRPHHLLQHHRRLHGHARRYIAGHAYSRHQLRLHSVIGHRGNSGSCPGSRAELLSSCCRRASRCCS